MKKEGKAAMGVVIYILMILLTAYYLFCTYQSVRAVMNRRLKKCLRTAAGLRCVSAAVVLMAIGLFLIVHIGDEAVTYSYTNGIVNETSSYGRFEPVFFIMFSVAAALIIVSIPFDYKAFSKNNTHVRNIAVSLISCVAVAVIGMFVIVSNYSRNISDNDPKYFRFDSPINNRSIVICEHSHSQGGYGDVYQVQGNRAEKIGNFTTDDGFRNGGRYRFEWTASQVTITYRTGENTGNESSVTAKFVQFKETEQ
ncbi:MAG: hypothetical protein II574_01925 [Ruminococcus sp.]|nr:hypothetical protein [Ruminococcus sp.]